MTGPQQISDHWPQIQAAFAEGFVTRQLIVKPHLLEGLRTKD